jgi:succinoglycan biosynthesis protein ExoO
LLLTGSRLGGPVQRYALTNVVGPQVRQLGQSIFVTSPEALAGQIGRAVLRRLPPALGTAMRRARHKADMVLGAFPSPEDVRWCARAVALMQPAAILIDTIFRAPLLAEPELKGRNSILIAHDIFHRRAQAMEAAGYSVQPRNLTRASEALLLGRARAIAAIQPEEAAVISAMCPEADTFVTPMPALPCPPPETARRIPGRLVFVGSAGLPNLDGLRWFLGEIWPLLAGKSITLDIIGDCGTAMRRLPPGVQAYGRVPHLAPYLHRAALAIAPLRAGSGLKVKLLDYARHGLATVVTPPALAGFQPDGNAPFIVAGSATMFAEAVRRLTRNPPPPAEALAYCTRHYGVAASFAALEAALRADGGQRAQHAIGAIRL